MAQAIYAVTSKTGMNDGDDQGNHWLCGWSLYFEESGWDVYEDDGEGNGDFVASFSSREEAEAFMDELSHKTGAEVAAVLRGLRV